MPKATLTIRSHRKNIKGQSSIFVRYSHRDASCFFACGVMVDARFWDSRTETIRKSCPGHSSLNLILIKCKSEIDELKMRLQLQDIEPTVDAVRNLYKVRNASISQSEENNETDKFLLDYYFQDFLSYQKNIKKLAFGTLKQYTSTGRQLAEFEKYMNTRFRITALNKQFMEQYLFYAFNIRECANNSVAARMKMIRCFGNWAFENSIITDISFRAVKKPGNKTDVVALNIEQIMELYELDLSNNKRLERVRDLYVLNSNLGLRFSDLHALTSANFKDGFLIFRTAKTDSLLRIPLNNLAKVILEKYNYNLPKISNQKFNRFLKELGKVAKFDALCEVHTFKRGIKERHLIPLRNLISSHQCRRNFATNCLRLGLPPSLTQKLTGHSSYAVFSKYISVADEYLANEFNKVWEGAYKLSQDPVSKTN